MLSVEPLKLQNSDTLQITYVYLLLELLTFE